MPKLSQSVDRCQSYKCKQSEPFFDTRVQYCSVRGLVLPQKVYLSCFRCTVSVTNTGMHVFDTDESNDQ